MSNLTGNQAVKHAGLVLAGMQVPIKTSSHIYMGAMVCLLTASGYAVRAGTALTGAVQGIAQAEAATPTSDGGVNVNLLEGVFAIAPDGIKPPTIQYVGLPVYAKDDNHVSYDSADGPVAGILIGFEATTGWPLVFINAATNYQLSQVTLASNLASTANALGASLVGIEDAGSFTTAANVEAALAELYQDVKSATVTKEIPISAMILAAGTPMAAFADDAGASSPGITLADSKAMGLRWNNFATQTAVFGRFNLPDDIDVTANATIEVYASKTGATLGDATTFTITAFNNASGALHDADTDFGGATSAMTGNATAKTVQKVTRTLVAADLGVAGEPVTFSIKPTNGTLGTDDVIIEGINLKYKRKIKTS